MFPANLTMENYIMYCMEVTNAAFFITGSSHHCTCDHLSHSSLERERFLSRVFGTETIVIVINSQNGDNDQDEQNWHGVLVVSGYCRCSFCHQIKVKV